MGPCSKNVSKIPKVRKLFSLLAFLVQLHLGSVIRQFGKIQLHLDQLVLLRLLILLTSLAPGPFTVHIPPFKCVHTCTLASSSAFTLVLAGVLADGFFPTFLLAGRELGDSLLAGRDHAWASGGNPVLSVWRFTAPPIDGVTIG